MIPLQLSVTVHFALVAKFDYRWHVLTCIGAYTFIALVDYITTEDVDRDPVELLAWPSSWAAQSVFAPKKHLKEQ